MKTETNKNTFDQTNRLSYYPDRWAIDSKRKTKNAESSFKRVEMNKLNNNRCKKYKLVKGWEKIRNLGS